jgi:hypothetical protein
VSLDAETAHSGPAAVRGADPASEAKRSPGVRSASAIGLACAVGLGCWISFQYSRAAWRPSSDNFVTVALWRGFREHGFGFLGSWSYTQDNWLFSLIPISSAVFAVFGATPQAVLALGWGFFLAAAALAAFIAARLAGRTAGLTLGAILLFASPAALGRVGYLSYPISHDISMAWGLGAIALALVAVERQAPLAAALAAVAVFLDTVSDPWAGAAVALPMVLASGGLALRRPERRRCTAGLALGCLAAFVCARTRLFGVLGFLPPSRFELTDLAGMAANLHWARHALARMFNILPGVKVTAPGVETFDILAWTLLMAAAAASALFARRRMSLERQFAVTLAILSMAAVGVLFVVGRWAPRPDVGRFFPNFYFLGAILVAAQLAFSWRVWPRWARAAVLVYASLFVVAGAVDRPDIWLENRPAPDAVKARALGAFLASQGLGYGYGQFWGAGALTMDTYTGGRVTIRPVSYENGRIRRRPAETSSYWFAPDAEPAAGRVFLVVNKSEDCPDPRLCEAVAVRQFGPPRQRLQFTDAAILVWAGPLVTKIAP